MWLVKVRQYITRALFITLNIFLVVFVIRFFILDVGLVSGPSMEPTFKDAEFILVSKAPLFFRSLRRLETVQLVHPQRKDYVIIKRIIGLPGETVTFRQNKVCVENKKTKMEQTCLDEPYLTPGTITQSHTKDFEPIEIPEGYYFVMGDRRLISADSRDFGPIPRHLILGTAFSL